MQTTREDKERWKARGRSMGATHVIVVCDTFNYDDYPVFVLPGESVEAKEQQYKRKEMTMIMEVIDLAKSFSG